VGPANESGDGIYNGADDNASGTSLLMEIASAFAELPSRPARSVVFLAVSGEEKGLLGSAHFASAPTVPIASIVANLNFDMVGRNHPDTVYLIGEDYTTLGAAAHQAAVARPEVGLALAPDPEPDEQLFLRSDHYSFVQRRIPAIMFTTGLHDDYHLPSDAPETIDSDKAARIGRLIFYLTHSLASDPVAPTWTEAGLRLLREELGIR
jgi:Zn-dependent M28 family amino/carboxypeptidase